MHRSIRPLRFRSFLFLSLFLGLPNFLVAQTENLPPVFVLGSYTEAHDALYETYQLSLFDVWEENLDSTFVSWEALLIDMERYAEEIAFDLKGVQLMLAVFWAPDGSVDYLTYGLLPTSINKEEVELTAFFKQYIKHSRWKKESNKPFFHDGRAGFPVRPILFRD